MAWTLTGIVCAACVCAACTGAAGTRDALLGEARAIHDQLDRGDYVAAEAAARAHFDRVNRTVGTRSPEAGDAADLLLETLLANGRGSSDEARALATLTVERKEAALGAGDARLEPALRNLARVREDTLQDGAIALLERALAIHASTRSGSAAELARTQAFLSLALDRADRLDEAVQSAERGVAAASTQADVRERARSLEALVRVLQSKGEYERAGASLAQAMGIRRPTDAAHPEFVETLTLLAFQESAQGRFTEAHQAASDAVALAERAFRPDHPATARALRQLALATRELWDLDAARELQQRALAMAERGLGGDHPEIAAYLNGLANATLLLGDYETARTMYSRALAVREKAFGEQHDSVATVVFNLALVDASLGDYERARQEYGRASSIWEGVFGSDHVIVARALVAQGTVLRRLGRPSDAVPVLERGFEIQQRRLGPRHRSVAVTLIELAGALHELGRDGEARERIDAALEIWRGANSPADARHAEALEVSADLYLRGGAPDRAVAEYRRAVAMVERVAGPAHPDAADARMGLARALTQTSRQQEALGLAQNAERTGREHLRLMLRSLPERQALAYAAIRPRGIDLLLSLARGASPATVAAIDAVIRGRALVLDEVAARSRLIDPRMAADHAAESQALARAQQRVANLVVQGPGAMPRARYDQLLDEATRTSEAAERRAAAVNAGFRAERSRAQAGLEDVLAALPPDTALVSYVRYERADVDRRTAESRPEAADRGAYLAFVLRANRPPFAVALGAARTIDDEISAWRDEVGAVPFAVGNANPQRPPAGEAGHRLRRRLWDPITGQIAGSSSVLVVTDGAVSLLPLAALPSARGSYLVEDAPPIHYLTAERDVIESPQGPAASLGLMALGGATFDSLPRTATLRGAPVDCGSLQSIVFEPLDGTRDEVQEITRLWPSPLGVPQTYLGADATEPLFKREAHRHRVLHLATHGFFLDGSCGPMLRAARSRGVGGLSSAVESRNPLRLSGLALAGANRRAEAKPDEDDGILTAEEVATLDLSGVEWAVLSACDTGVGEIKAGEGVFGLRRAFQVAGARTVIMSLWSVEDQATRAWMRALYEGRFQRKLSTADAVHQASLTVLRDRRAKGLSTHPFFWAAFVAAGDWK